MKDKDELYVQRLINRNSRRDSMNSTQSAMQRRVSIVELMINNNNDTKNENRCPESDSSCDFTEKVMSDSSSAIDMYPFINKSTLKVTLSKRKCPIRTKKSTTLSETITESSSRDSLLANSSPSHSRPRKSIHKTRPVKPIRVGVRRQELETRSRGSPSKQNWFSKDTLLQLMAEKTSRPAIERHALGESRDSLFCPRKLSDQRLSLDVRETTTTTGALIHPDFLPTVAANVDNEVTTTSLIDSVEEFIHVSSDKRKCSMFSDNVISSMDFQYNQCRNAHDLENQDADSGVSLAKWVRDACGSTSSDPSTSDVIHLQAELLPESERMSEPESDSMDSDGSFTKYLADPVNKKISQQLFVKDYDLEEEFAKGNAELLRQGPDQFFNIRLLETLEPKVTPVKPKITRQCDSVEDYRSSDAQTEQISWEISMLSKEIRALDEEIRKLDIKESVIKEAEANPMTEAEIFGTLNQHCNRQFHDNETKPEFFTPMHTPYFGASKAPLRSPSPIQSRESVDPTLEKPAQGKIYDIPITSAQLKAVERIQADGKSANFIDNLTPHGKFRQPPCHESTFVEAEAVAKSPTLSQVNSTISSIMPNTPPCTNERIITVDKMSAQERNLEDRLESVHESLKHNENATKHEKYEMTIPEEVENFLYNALGTEHYVSINTNTDQSNRISNSIIIDGSGSDLFKPADYQAPCTKSLNSETLSNRSRAFNRLKTFSHRLKKKLRRTVMKPDNSCELTTELIEVSPSLHEKVQALRAHVEVQQTLIFQAAKALSLCCSMPEFIASLERVESERALLLAKLRNQAYLDEIVQLTSKGYCAELNQHQFSAQSDLELRDIKLKLRENIIKHERLGNGMVEWFLLVVSEGQRVWASRAICYSRSSPQLSFPDSFVIGELDPNFRVTIRVYSLQLRQQNNFDHDERYHLQRHQQNFDNSYVSCPAHLLRNNLMRSRRTSVMSTMGPRQENINVATKNSSFIECGNLELTLRDIRTMPPWNLKAVPSNSALYGTIEMKAECKIKLISIDGFVNFGEEVQGQVYWTRFYCALENHYLFFWKYPHNRDVGALPERTIDLSRCTTQRVELVDRSLCARPKTLLIATARSRRDSLDADTTFMQCRGKSTIVGTLIAFDEKDELAEWQEKLNYVVSVLRAWIGVVEV
ncbi:uncharacterized protein LOC106646822 isoform X2 [Copidosoma floridanum]|uniref:uncharacterized protein LOC106646822 isoform X2 n=1 Tax=Copidosoma floridanum TaxID=29053 RepID=UPI0006C949BC|nr:uncharacterized protein LOC106646822 isoform X2 [Copidosoma floridanum]